MCHAITMSPVNSIFQQRKCLFGSTSFLFHFLYHLMSNNKTTNTDRSIHIADSAYQNPQLMVPVPQIDSLCVNSCLLYTSDAADE